MIDDIQCHFLFNTVYTGILTALRNFFFREFLGQNGSKNRTFEDNITRMYTKTLDVCSVIFKNYSLAIIGKIMIKMVSFGQRHTNNNKSLQVL